MNVFKEAGMSYQAICLLAGTLALLGLVFAYLFDRAKKAASRVPSGMQLLQKPPLAAKIRSRVFYA